MLTKLSIFSFSILIYNCWLLFVKQLKYFVKGKMHFVLRYLHVLCVHITFKAMDSIQLPSWYSHRGSCCLVILCAFLSSLSTQQNFEILWLMLIQTLSFVVWKYEFMVTIVSDLTKVLCIIVLLAPLSMRTFNLVNSYLLSVSCTLANNIGMGDSSLLDLWHLLGVSVWLRTLACKLVFCMWLFIHWSIDI